MDKINNISDKFEEIVELKALCEKQYRELVSLLEKNKQLEDEIGHLKTLITSNDSFVIQAPQMISPEELICLEQIGRLKICSQQNELTHEEVKKFSELVKTLKLIRNKELNKEEILSGFKTEDLLKVIDGDTK
jgi:hypothetical protein